MAGKAEKQRRNLERKKAKMRVKKDIDIVMEEYKLEEIEALNDDEYYKLETDDGEPLFKGQWILGSLIKSMVKEYSKIPKDDK